MNKLKIFFLMITLSTVATLGMVTFSTAENSSDTLDSQEDKYSKERIICRYKLKKMNNSMKPGEKKRTPVRCFREGKSLVEELRIEHQGKMVTKKEDGLYISGEKIA